MSDLAVPQLMEVTQQPPVTTQGHPLSHLTCTFPAASAAFLPVTARLDHCHTILNFAVIPQTGPKVAISKKSNYEVRKLPAGIP